MKEYVHNFRKLIMNMPDDDLEAITVNYISRTGNCPGKFGLVDIGAPMCNDCEKCWRKALEGFK